MRNFSNTKNYSDHLESLHFNVEEASFDFEDVHFDFKDDTLPRRLFGLFEEKTLPEKSVQFDAAMVY